MNHLHSNTFDKMYIFLKPTKTKQYPKTCLDLFLKSGYNKIAKFSKAFHCQGPLLYFTYLSIHAMHLSIFPNHEYNVNKNPIFQCLKGGSCKLL